ncbi:sugar ABC transporter ATP-binding protein [Aquamicrobium sp. NLF2-7]|uniref:sugar ABC transporter ATP-binding protein n=1 Tax=Aquamicrobium sp. NLF2-7 TaxID=2918753 RepID=UPI001EFC1C60|nr:sugar ABC transporter ATP-binding protein [Aquamicrobium sp. NLF2-7]MCG8273298.1 sugar ABC transporter ATP-binding protein [Aquamicrobium sp. NLF2-7]
MDRRPPALELRGVSKQYGPVTALSSVDLRLERHEVLGLIGENGAGKSTLISVINGTVSPSEGQLLAGGNIVSPGSPADAARAGIATVFQEQGLVASLPVFENILLGREAGFSRGGVLSRKAMARFAADVLNELGIAIDPFAITGSLAFGERQLVEIAKAFALGRIYPVEPVILLDEPTSALSDAETQILFNSIRRWRGKASIILVSHRLSDVFAVCDRVAALKDGTVNGTWPVSEVTADTLHEAIVGRPRSAGYYKESEQREDFGEIVLEVRDLVVPGQIEGVSLTVRAGEILGVAGVLGSGKTALGHAITGAVAGKGEIAVDGRRLRPGSRAAALAADVGSVPAERNSAGVIGMHSVEWNLTLPSLKSFRRGRWPVLSAKKQAGVTDDWIRRLRVRTPNRAIQIRNLSGGNAQKVVFAKWLARGIRLFVLDDPGRGLDVGAKEEIYALLRKLAREGVAIVLISDNLPEIIGLSNRILTLRAGKISAELAAPAHDKPAETAVVTHMV